MKILLGFHHYPYPFDVGEWVGRWLARISAATGHSVDRFCLTLDPPGPPLSWPELDLRWKHGERSLLKMYETLARTIENYDVFINWNGINLHPDFVRLMPVFKVFCCFDDPEQSENFSKPAAAAYDLCLVGNIAELDSYRKWGARNVEFWPMGFHAGDHDSRLTKEAILCGERDVEVTLLCERENKWRESRLDRYVAEFPRGKYFGKGWPRGFLPEEEKVPLYQRTLIGPNFHNSTGPINFRTYVLPANGVMQLCDNKAHLGKIFELNKEVVGFDTVDEAIDLTRYYLAHDDERRSIAAAGWERAMRDYNEIAVFEKAVSAITRISKTATGKPDSIIIRSALRTRRLKTLPRRLGSALKSLVKRIITVPKR